MTTLTHLEARAHLHQGRRWLDNKTAAALDAHLAACAECRAYAADLETLAPALSEALHARWDGVQPPRPRRRDEADTARRAPRRLGPAFTVVPVGLVLLLGIILLPLLIAPPPAATPPPLFTQPIAGLPSPTPPAVLDRVLFAVDAGTFSGPPEASHVDSAPRVIAWDPVAESVLWETEVGLEPSLAVDRAGGLVYVVSRPNVERSTLAGHTFDYSTVAARGADWPLRVTELDPASGRALRSFDLSATLGPMAPLGVVRGRLHLFRFDLSTLDHLELFTGAHFTGVTACGDGARANSAQFAPDGSAIYALCWPIQVGAGEPFVPITPLPSGQSRTLTLAPLGSPNGMLLSHDGTRLYVVDTHQGIVGEINTAAGLLVRTSLFKGTSRASQAAALMALAPDGRVLYITTVGGTEIDRIRAVDVFSLETIGVLDPSPAVPKALVASGDKLYIATDLGLGSADVPGSQTITYHSALPPTVAQVVPYSSAVTAADLGFPMPDPGERQLIAYESASDIFVTNTGSGPRNLTQRPGPDNAPAWSPNGRYLAYLADRGDRTDVMVLDVDEALSTTDLIAPVRVYQGPAGFFINVDLPWSPDGTRLAVTTWPSTNAEPTTIQVLDVTAALNGVNNRLPVLTIDAANGPKFSPDGTRLLYAGRDEAGQSALYVHDLASGERFNLIAGAGDGPWSYHAYAWSPSGKFIAYLRVSAAGAPPESSRAELVIAAPDGSQHPVVLTLSPAPNGLYGLSYSPDGKTLLFVSDRETNGCWQLHLFSLASQVLSRLEGVCYSTFSALPSWSPDSRFLVFTAGWSAGRPNRGTGGDLELTLVDVAQALANPAQVQPFRLTHWVGDDLSPVFRP